MATCKLCRAKIGWARTSNGKNMPVDVSERPFVPDGYGPDFALLMDGTFTRGKLVSDSSEDGYVLAYPSHFGTCPARRKNENT